MERKYKIILWDIFDNADQYLDTLFNEDTVELCEIFTSDDKGININSLPYFDENCWDYLVIPFTGNNEKIADSIAKIIALLKIPGNKVICLDDNSLKVHADVAVKIFKGVAEKRADYFRRINGDYISLTVEGLSFVNRASDKIIMLSMFALGKVWACDQMKKFFRLSQRHFVFSKDQDIFLDIGANIGTTCIYFKKRLDEKVKIIAFEPSNENYKLIRINALLNEIPEDEIRFEHIGLSDKEEKLFLSYNSSNPGGSNFLSEVRENDQNGNFTDLIPLDHYVEVNNLDVSRLKYIWVDVEGFEPKFLEGAQKTVRRINIPIIMEFTPALYKREGNYESYLELLRELFEGYINMDDPEEKIRAIEELRELDDAGQTDIFLLRNISGDTKKTCFVSI